MLDELQIVEERNRTIYKSNWLIQKARYDLTAGELRIMNYLFSKVKPTDSVDTVYTLTVTDYLQICGLSADSGKHYQQVRQGLKRLADKSFWIMTEDGTEILVRWINDLEGIPKTGRFKIRFHKVISEHVHGLFSNYTQLTFLNMLPMRSAYSVRIYELLSSVKFNHTSYKIQMEELRRMLGLEDRYPNFKDFRRRVLDVAVKETNKYTNLLITYEPIMTGRKVTGINFRIKQKDRWSAIDAKVQAQDDLDSIKGQYRIVNKDMETAET